MSANPDTKDALHQETDERTRSLLKRLQRQAKRSDEISFCLGVANVVFTTYLLAAAPARFWIFHCAKCTVLLLFRFFKFRAKKWHYFLLDFCYIVNIWSVLYCGFSFVRSLEIVPRSWSIPYLNATVFRIAFAWGVGPLAWSIPVFRNALTFHSEDHITVLFIHASPNLLMWALRWHAAEVANEFPGMFEICPNNDTLCVATAWDLIGIPFLTYIVLWSIPYAMWMFVFRASRIKQRGYVTMYTLMKSSGLLMKLTAGLSETSAQIVYMVIHGVLVLISMVPALVMWNNAYAHMIWILLVLAIATWNGSTFYFEVFAERYAAQIREDVERRLKHD